MDNIIKLIIGENIDRRELFGNLDKNLKILKEYFKVDIIQRDNELVLKGDDAKLAEKVMGGVDGHSRDGRADRCPKVHYVISLVENGMSYIDGNMSKEVICYTHTGKPL